MENFFAGSETSATTSVGTIRHVRLETMSRCIARLSPWRDLLSSHRAIFRLHDGTQLTLIRNRRIRRTVERTPERLSIKVGNGSSTMAARDVRAVRWHS
jgi:hypothetical protein